MTGPWIVAFAALVLLVLVLSIFVLGLLGQVDAALAAVASRLPDERGALFGLEVGQQLPLVEFESPELGAPIRFHQSVVVFVSQGCAPCEVLLADLAAHATTAQGWLRVLVWEGGDERPDPALDGWLIVARQGAVLRRMFKTSSSPSAFVVDREGRIAAAGIPNSSDDVRRLVRLADERADTRPPTARDEDDVGYAAHAR
jgi:hypothetical protein